MSPAPSVSSPRKPETDAEAEQLLDELGHQVEIGTTYFVMDFGHPLDPEPAVRFAEQVITPMRSSRV